MTTEAEKIAGCELCKRVCPSAGKKNGQRCGFYRQEASKPGPRKGSSRCHLCEIWIGQIFDRPITTCRRCGHKFCQACYPDHAKVGECNR